MMDPKTPDNPAEKQPVRKLTPTVDYYFNAQGLMVFTAAYLLQRGYCCNNKCKHCPYSS